MSGETQSLNNKNHLENHFEKKQNSKPKVDINQLLNRVRDEKKKERKENLLLLSLVGSVIVITGIIASL
tara:strand:+ start:1139 stop:1345 length:207 start_codon:yes stop_codon:yes gene_type:complete